jgi:DNA-binding IclR family transcriptional regulator
MKNRASVVSPPKPPDYAVESVDNALRLLRMFGETKQIRLSEAAERLGVAPSTAHRLISMLVYHGFAAQDGRGREYRPGPTLIEMGFAAIRDMDLRQHARPVLERLRTEVNETVHLAIPYGQNILYVEGIESTQLLRIGSRAGALVPAHCVSAGKALLATLSRDQLRVLYPTNDLATLTDRSVATRTELERQLQKVRRDGYARTREESEDGVTSIAIAIRDQRDAARAAISIAAPLSRGSVESEAGWVAAARKAAAELSTRLWNVPS